ncbi:MAG: hypothetical protein IJJ86_01535 [Clostridia bacterium]|nr:hypothetical protein [Clostridia bacterium]
MSDVFLHLLNISITAGWIVLIVMLLRFLLKKAPKWTRVVAWGLVALRLLLPVSIQSVLSLVPSAETVRVESVSRVSQSDPSSVPAPAAGDRIVIETGIPLVNSAVAPIAERTAEHTDTIATVKTVAGWVWLSGAIAMLLYAAISFLRLRLRVRASVRLEKGLYACDEIKDPFILGLIVPRIYLPSGIDEEMKGYVLAHERAHLRRFDHIWKPLGFLLLAVYWFNPLLWFAYILLCRDIELACDEKVVKEYDAESKAAYSEALVKSSVSRRSIAACPLAFGETGVKSRVKSILNYKKPAFWIILVAILCCIAVAVCFLTVPKKKANTYVGTWELEKIVEGKQEYGADFLGMMGLSDTIVLRADGTGSRITESDGVSEIALTYTAEENLLTITFAYDGPFQYENMYYAAFDRQEDTLTLYGIYDDPDEFKAVYTRAGSEHPVPPADLTVEKLIGVWNTDPNDQMSELLSGTLVFSEDGSARLILTSNFSSNQMDYNYSLDGNTVRFAPGGEPGTYVIYDPNADTLSFPIANVGILTFTRSEVAVPAVESTVTSWLDYYSASDQMPWGEAKETAVEAFPNIRFRWTSGAVEAVDALNSAAKSDTLFTGMPIWNVFFADVTGDGKPELCASVSYGSGMVDEHIVVYDYENRQSYTLWDRGTFDYHVYTENGALYVGKTPYNGDKQIDYGTLTMQDDLLCCRWSDGSVTVLNRELHESELYGEWLVREETDNDGNVLYQTSIDLWKEYRFQADGTVTYNETVPISSDSELAFGHPVSYPYEVHNDYVYIAGDDTSGAFRWGSYDRDTRTLTLMYGTDAGTVYAKLRRMGEETQNEAALDEATLCTVWMLAEIEAPDGSSGDARALGLERYLAFRSDGTVRVIDAKAPSDRVVPYTLNGNTVQFDGRVFEYDHENNELFGVDPSTQDILFYVPAPNAVLPAETP